LWAWAWALPPPELALAPALTVARIPAVNSQSVKTTPAE
jgi:hypothetical protein